MFTFMYCAENLTYLHYHYVKLISIHFYRPTFLEYVFYIFPKVHVCPAIPEPFCWISLCCHMILWQFLNVDYLGQYCKKCWVWKLVNEHSDCCIACLINRRSVRYWMLSWISSQDSRRVVILPNCSGRWLNWRWRHIHLDCCKVVHPIQDHNIGVLCTWIGVLAGWHGAAHSEGGEWTI